MPRSLASLVLAVALAPACGSKPASTTTATGPSKMNAPDYQAMCVEVMTKNRTCTDAFLPALVDARARHDVPAGIAEKVKQDRDGVIAMAREEWKTDSTDEAIGTTCTRLVGSLDDAGRADAEGAHACVAQADCAAYTACAVPYFEKHFTK